MPVRLNITIDDDVHKRLKGELPPKGVSRFINEAVRARLRPGRDELGQRGYIVGGYRYPTTVGAGGRFVLALRTGPDGRWLIAADLDNSGPRPAP
ncbi:MAG: hypothetical protein U0163_00985 [Gemmatimonadaceae bacterium]